MSLLKKLSKSQLSSLIWCRSSGASKSKDKTLSSLERFQQVTLFIIFITIILIIIICSLQFFTEEKTSSLLSPKGSRLLGHAEDLNVEANAALQALLLLSAM